LLRRQVDSRGTCRGDRDEWGRERVMREVEVRRRVDGFVVVELTICGGGKLVREWGCCCIVVGGG